MPKEHIVEKSLYYLLELYEICWETKLLKKSMEYHFLRPKKINH